MSSFPVAGQVEVQGRQATLTLTLPDPTPEAKVKMFRPTTENIEAKIDARTIKVHPTRQPITKKMITNAMGNVQRMLLLPGGASGDWNPRAQVRLEALLAKPISSKIAKPLAMEDKKDKTEFKDAKALAIEDKKSTVEEKVAKSSSSDSSSSSSHSEDNSMQVSPSEKNVPTCLRLANLLLQLVHAETCQESCCKVDLHVELSVPYLLKRHRFSQGIMFRVQATGYKIAKGSFFWVG